MAIDLTPQRKAAIIVAPNGARKSKSDHPNLPITTEEIIEDVIQCRDAGAAMVHLHVRDRNGKHSLDIEDNQKLYNAVKMEVQESIIVQLTTEAVGLYSAEQQMALTQAVKPEAASFALCELIPTDSDHDIERGKAFFYWVWQHNIVSQIILYNQADIDRFLHFIETGVLPKTKIHTLIVLGRYKPMQCSSPWDLYHLELSQLRNSSIRTAVCAFGKMELQCLASALLLGFDVRVGFENNHLEQNGNLAKNNANQVRSIKNINIFSNFSLHNAYSFWSEINKPT